MSEHISGGHCVQDDFNISVWSTQRGAETRFELLSVVIFVLHRLVDLKRVRTWTIHSFSFYLSSMLVNEESLGFRLKKEIWRRHFGLWKDVTSSFHSVFFFSQWAVKRKPIVCSFGSHVSSQRAARNVDEICARHLEPELGQKEGGGENTPSISRERLLIPFPRTQTHKPNKKTSSLFSSQALVLLTWAVCLCCFFVFFKFWKQTCPPVYRWQSSE